MKRAIIAAAIATLATGAAFATEPMNTATAMDSAATFKSLDTDGNGRISESEARAHAELSAGYKNAVSDARGGMTMDEFSKWNSSQKPAQAPPSN